VGKKSDRREVQAKARSETTTSEVGKVRSVIAELSSSFLKHKNSIRVFQSILGYPINPINNQKKEKYY